MDKLFWLSFADGTRAKGSQFLGAAIVRASHMTEAIEVAHRLGINPGGEVRGCAVEYQPGIKPIPASYIERLLDKPEIDRLCVAIGDEGAVMVEQ